MGDLISREAAVQMLREKAHGNYPSMFVVTENDLKIVRTAITECINEVLQMPAVDAVEVVRCKDCKYMLPLPEDRAPYYGDWVKVCALGRGDLNKGQSVVWPDDFCSEGVRRR